MPFDDWDTLATGQLVLPIRGKKYTIPPLGYLDEIKLRKSQEAVKKALENEEPPPKDALTNEQYYTMLLGPVLDRMRKDNVPPAAIAHAAMVAHTDATEGRIVAERMWNVALDPEALAASMQAAQEAMAAAKSSKATPRSRSTAAASRTRSRASTKTTRSRKVTQPTASKAKPSTSTRRSPNIT